MPELAPPMMDCEVNERRNEIARELEAAVPAADVGNAVPARYSDRIYLQSVKVTHQGILIIRWKRAGDTAAYRAER